MVTILGIKLLAIGKLLDHLKKFIGILALFLSKLQIFFELN